MAIYDNDGTASREIGKLYDHNGSANTQIGKVYDHNGSANSLIYTSALPTTLMTGSSVAAEVGGWVQSTEIWESTTWKWNAPGSAAMEMKPNGYRIYPYPGATLGSRNGRSIRSGSLMDWSGTSRITFEVTHDANGYYNTGNACNGSYLFCSALLQASIGSAPLCFQMIRFYDHIGSQLNVSAWFSVDIPASVGNAYLLICVFNTDNCGASAIIKNIWTTER